MKDQFIVSTDQEENLNVIDALLLKIFPGSPNTRSLIKFLIRLFGYGILTYFGIDVVG